MTIYPHIMPFHGNTPLLRAIEQAWSVPSRGRQQGGHYRPLRQNSPPDGASGATLLPWDPHFIYTLSRENGRLAAKPTLQAADKHWLCLIDHVA